MEAFIYGSASVNTHLWRHAFMETFYGCAHLKKGFRKGTLTKVLL